MLSRCILQRARPQQVASNYLGLSRCLSTSKPAAKSQKSKYVPSDNAFASPDSSSATTTPISASDRYAARVALISDLTARGAWQPYPSSFANNISIPTLLERFAHLKPGEAAPSESLSIAGRVTSRRDASSKLIFFDVECGIREENTTLQTDPSNPHNNTATPSSGKGRRVQIMFTERQYAAANADVVLNAVRRGDIVGTVYAFVFSSVVASFI
jgi:lysyl-tRNA synthetase class II